MSYLMGYCEILFVRYIEEDYYTDTQNNIMMTI